MCWRSSRPTARPPIASAFWGDEIERISEIDTLTGEIVADHQQVDIFPAKHFVTPQEKLEEAIEEIRSREMDEQVRPL
jgi:excinuclease ABC subunit B